MNEAVAISEKRLGRVTSFKYLGTIISDGGSKPEMLSRITQTASAMAKLKPLWNDKNILLGSKIKLMRTLAISISRLFLYACETWTLTADLERRIQALELRCFRKILNISYKDHVTNEENSGSERLEECTLTIVEQNGTALEDMLVDLHGTIGAVW
ncbi:uncharacterized protein [Amphiura filiformis]|uniref:uncharacterized protein n=1 Tax=Amphiura filiformis TaxID=82378 RepID=UPI003B221E3A